MIFYRFGAFWLRALVRCDHAVPFFGAVAVAVAMILFVVSVAFGLWGLAAQIMPLAPALYLGLGLALPLFIATLWPETVALLLLREYLLRATGLAPSGHPLRDALQRDWG